MKLSLARRFGFLALFALITLPHARAHGATVANVDAALQKGKAALYKLQSPDGTWEKVATRTAGAPDNSTEGGQHTGMTALAVYALLSAGDRPGDDGLVRAIDFLKKTDTVGTYALGLRCQIWLMLPQTPEVKQLMQKDVGVLLRSAKTQGNAQGMYDYAFDKTKNYSHSRAQYAVLGIWAAERAGARVPEAFWPVVEKAWIRNQDPSGGWTYKHPVDNKSDNHPVTPGMTAVGVATLFITQDYVNPSAGAACKGNVNSEPITKGMKWMADNMSKVATDEQYKRDFHYATLYAVERIGVAAGLKYIGGVDWYQKGADWLIKKQGKDGNWKGGGLTQGGSINDTCFAILFLARGRAPLVMNKLDYSADPAKPAAWNQRPRDVANVVRWISSNTERDLGWQSVTFQAPVADLAEAPVLYIAGSDALAVTDDQRAKLKAYVDTGGLILAHADCGRPEFSTSFRKLAGEMYPNYEFRELPADSPVYSVFQRTKWKTKPSILSVSNGVREIMMLIPQADPGRAWQTRQVAGKEELYQLAANIFLYSTNKEKLQYRGASYVVTPDPKVTPTRTIDVVRVQFDGNWNPEPGGYPRLAGLFRNQRKIDLKVTPVKAGGDFGKAKFAHLTGTGKFILKPDQVEQLRKFVAGGGTLLIDAAGGDAEFATAAEALAPQLVPGGKLAVLPPDAPLFKAVELKDFRYRTYARMKSVGTANAPRLQAIDVNGRPAVLVSREDLSAGLLGPEMDGIIGYEPDTAVQIVSAAILNAAGK